MQIQSCLIRWFSDVKSHVFWYLYVIPSNSLPIPKTKAVCEALVVSHHSLSAVLSAVRQEKEHS